MLQALAGHRGFVVYRLAKLPNGKTDKIPFNPVTGYDSNAQDQTTWLTPDLATAHAAAWASHFPQGTGVGIVIYEGSQLFCVDIDGAVIEGVPSEFAQSIMDRFPGAYMELSQSKKGLHIFGIYRGVLPPHKTKNIHKHIELYTKLRFIALTDHTLGGHVGTDCTDVLTAFALEYFPKADGDYEGEWTTEPAKGWNFLTDDTELLQWASTYADRNVKFQNKPSPALLMSGTDELGKWFPSQTGNAYDASSADQAMANFFGWATGNNCERVRALMLRTGLRRDKWDREDYFHRTIARGCTAHGPFPTIKSVPTRAEVPQGPASNPVPQAPQSAEVPQAPGIVPQAPLVPQAPGPFIPEPTALPTEWKPHAGATAFLDQQLKLWAGCLYVRDLDCIMMPAPKGGVLKERQFNATYGGMEFVVTPDGSDPSTKAWDAFIYSKIHTFPRVEGLLFDPREAPGAIIQVDGLDYINTWAPLDIESIPGDVMLFRQHLRKLWPVGDDALILESYLKFMVQHKGVKASWAPFLQGVEGNGKSFINATMTYCLGQKYTQTLRASQLDSRFNAHMYQKLFYPIEDMHRGDDPAVWETLKPMITERVMEIEGKGFASVAREMCGNFILNSNHKDGIRKTGNDRRIAPLFAAQQHIDHLARDGLCGDYFPILWGWAEQGGWAHVLHFLSTDPIDPRYNPAAGAGIAPTTSSTMDAISAGLGNAEQEVLDAIEEGKEGFMGGWVSSVALDQLLQRIGKGSAIPKNKRTDMLGTLGYIPHPGLPNGRAVHAINGHKPRLYIKKGHPLTQMHEPKDIKEAYEMAQRVT